jgi:hypothetical protein
MEESNQRGSKLEGGTTLFAEMIKKKNLREKLEQRQQRRQNNHQSDNDVAIIEERRSRGSPFEGRLLRYQVTLARMFGRHLWYRFFCIEIRTVLLVHFSVAKQPNGAAPT